MSLFNKVNKKPITPFTILKALGNGISRKLTKTAIKNKPEYQVAVKHYLLSQGWDNFTAGRMALIVEPSIFNEIITKCGYFHMDNAHSGAYVCKKDINGTRKLGISININKIFREYLHVDISVRDVAINSLLVHELIHIDQIQRGDLIMDDNAESGIQSIIWKGLKFTSNEMKLHGSGCSEHEYRSTPWEDEAYAKQEKYLRKFGLKSMV